MHGVGAEAVPTTVMRNNPRAQRQQQQQQQQQLRSIKLTQWTGKPHLPDLLQRHVAKHKQTNSQSRVLPRGQRTSSCCARTCRRPPGRGAEASPSPGKHGGGVGLVGVCVCVMYMLPLCLRHTIEPGLVFASHYNMYTAYTCTETRRWVLGWPWRARPPGLAGGQRPPRRRLPKLRALYTPVPRVCWPEARPHPAVLLVLRGHWPEGRSRPGWPEGRSRPVRAGAGPRVWI